MRHISIAAIMLAGASHAFADPVGLLNDAQSIPSHRGGKVVIPASSLAGREDFANRAHTNVRFFAAAQTRVHNAAVSGPPYAGYNFETPASLACVYGLTAQAGGCNPNTITADLKYYSAQFGLPAPTASSFQVVFASGQQPAGNSGWELEMALDVQMAHAMAPNARLYLVEAASNSGSDLLAAVDKAAQLVASAGGGDVSMSWGSAEFPGETSYDYHFQKSGVIFLASTGDSPGVEWPSASANVVAVGGMSLSRQLGSFTFLHHASCADGGGAPAAMWRAPPTSRPSPESSAPTAECQISPRWRIQPPACGSMTAVMAAGSSWAALAWPLRCLPAL